MPIARFSLVAIAAVSLCMMRPGPAESRGFGTSRPYGSHRGRPIARHVATGARAAATLHICRGRPFDLDARAGHRSPVWQCCVHWVPDHPKVLARLLWSLPAGGVLAVQMPDNTNEPALMLMEKVELKASTHVGPVVDRSQLDQDLRYIAPGKEEGAKLHWGWRSSQPRQSRLLSAADAVHRG